MLPIPRVNSFCCSELKSGLLETHYARIPLVFVVEITILIKIKSSWIEPMPIFLAFDILLLLLSVTCMYGITQNKPKFMLPELIVGTFLILILITILIFFPVVALAAIKFGAFTTVEAIDVLGWTLTWIFVCFVFGVVTYYMIALYSLYMCIIEDALDVARDDMDQQMNLA